MSYETSPVLRTFRDAFLTCRKLPGRLQRCTTRRENAYEQYSATILFLLELRAISQRSSASEGTSPVARGRLCEILASEGSQGQPLDMASKHQRAAAAVFKADPFQQSSVFCSRTLYIGGGAPSQWIIATFRSLAAIGEDRARREKKFPPAVSSSSP